MVFLEDNVYGTQGNRISRFWAAYGQGSAYYPLIIADSGHQYKSGWSNNLYNDYKNMVDAELSRPPQAEIIASQFRDGDKLFFDVWVKNISGVPLSNANDATVHVIVYEDTDIGVTSRHVRAAPYINIANPLENNNAATFSVSTQDLIGVDWAKIHAVAFVDYRPSGYSGPYDMLQASMVVERSFSVHPTSMSFYIDPTNPEEPTSLISFFGMPPTLSWSLTENIPWLTVSRTSGTITDTVIVQVQSEYLPPDEVQVGTITVTSVDPIPGGPIEIPVRAFLGEVHRVFLPVTFTNVD